jgi:DNA-binding LacI/PurR family transcriptional regulator
VPVNQNQIAKRLGISQRAVSFALNGKPGVSEATRQRITELAKEMGYRPSSAARAMRSSTSRQVGILMHDAGVKRSVRLHPFEFMVGMNSVLEPAGYVLSMVQMTDVETGDFAVKRVFSEHGLDGMIVVASLIEPVRRRLAELMEQVIWCDAWVKEPQGCLWRDELEAGRLAGQAAVDAGYRQLVFVREADTDPLRNYQHDQLRLAGVRAAAEPAGAEVIQYILQVRDGPPYPEQIEAFRPHLRRGVAIVASTYAHAPIIANFAMQHEMVPRRDYGLVCCDDSDEIRRQFPQLSRSTFDRFDMGRRAARMLLKRFRSADADVPSWVEVPTWHAGMTL